MTADRYVIRDEIASGGMATIHLGVRRGPHGFARVVAIKKLHAFFAKDPDFVSMFMDEARLAARVTHPNVLSVLDVVQIDGEPCLIMDYVRGESVAQLVRALERDRVKLPVDVTCAILVAALHGLHAAHEATSEAGSPLGIVHRDVSPQNLLVDVDGVTRVLDFGVAKAVDRSQVTRDGQIKGKLAYMAPEQLRGAAVDRRTDVYAAAVVLWELLARRPLFVGKSPPETMTKVLESVVEPPSKHAPEVSEQLDRIVMRGLARDPNERFATAEEMAVAIEAVASLAPPRVIGELVRATAKESLETREALLTTVQSSMDAVEHDDTIVEPPRPIPTSVEGGAPPRSPGRVGLAIAIGVLLVAAIAMGAFRLGRGEAGREPPAATSAASDGVGPAAATLSLGSPPIASAPPAASSTTVVASSSSSAKKPPPKVFATAKPKPAPNCTPPYTIAPDGVHIAKKECM